MRPLHESGTEKGLHRLLDVLLRQPRTFLVAQLAALAVCTGLGFSLNVRTDITDLVGEDLEFYRNDVRFETEFPAKDELIVVVESSEPARNRQFVERLGVKLEAEPRLFTNIFFKSDLSTLGPKALLFLPEENLEAIRRNLTDYQPVIQPLTIATNLNSLLASVNTRFEQAISEEQPDIDDLIRSVPALDRVLDQALYAVEHPGTPTAPGVTALFAEDGDTGREYLSIAEGRFFMLTVQPRSRAVLTETVTRLRTLLRETQMEVPGNNVGLTGLPVLHMDERIQVSQDITKAAIVALLLCTGIFILAYREARRPLKTSVCLVIGMGFAIGLAALTVGHLNLLSITFAPILIGLSIDAGIHLITRYEEGLRDGSERTVALRKAMIFTGAGILTSALATAAAFFAMVFTDFKGIREMGVIAGGGLIVCLIPMMTLLPLWLVRGRQVCARPWSSTPGARRQFLEQSWLRRPGFTVLVCGLLTLLAFSQVYKVDFEHNPLELQSEGLASVELADKLITTGDKSVAFASVDVATLQEAAEIEPKLAALESVASVESMTHYLTADQTLKLQLVARIKQQVAPLRLPEVDRGPVDLEALDETLYRLQGYLGLAAGEMQRQNNQKLLAQLLRIQHSIGELLDSEWHREPAVMAARLEQYQQALFNNLHQTLETIQNQDATSPLQISDLPESLRNRFVGITGRHVLRVYPKKNAWDRENQAEFVADVRRIAPWVTGTPVLLYEYIGLLSQSYREAVIYAVVFMAALAWFHFRSVISVLLALVPIGMGTVWLLGLMGALGIAFNPVNIMTIPLLVGIGVTNGIHILNRYSEERSPSVLTKSTGKAILVSALTTITGFGSLMLAHHKGIASLGYVMSIGVACCLVAALALLPCMIQLCNRVGWAVNPGTPIESNSGTD